MKFKSIGTIAILAFFVVLVSCKKEEEKTSEPDPIVTVYTDNTTYVNLDNIVFTIENKTPNTINYTICGFSHILDYEIQKRIDSEWVTSAAPTCPDFTWVDLEVNTKISDTISASNLDKGDYRFKMKLIIESNSTIMYSNIFNLK